MSHSSLWIKSTCQGLSSAHMVATSLDVWTPAPPSTFQFGKPKRQPFSPCLHSSAGLTSSVWGWGRQQPDLNLGDSLSPLPLSHCLGNGLQLGGDRGAAIVPVWCRYPGMLGCAYSLGLFTEDFLDHFPHQLLNRCRGFCTPASFCWKPAAVSGWSCLAILFRWARNSLEK